MEDDATMAPVVTARHNVTYAELSTWPDDGRRYELYDGEVFVVPAPLPRHQLAMLELYRQLHTHAFATGGVVIASPIDIVFTETNVLQPDIVVFMANHRGHVDLDAPIRFRPDVAVEVISPSTERNDRGRKLAWFQRFEVPEYWILDPVAERLEVFRLRKGQYLRPRAYGRGTVFESTVLAGFSCRVETLFPW
jgi:Uma2 family endonuclease